MCTVVVGFTLAHPQSFSNDIFIRDILSAISVSVRLGWILHYSEQIVNVFNDEVFYR